MDNFYVSDDINPTTSSLIDPINEILREGARKILQEAIENEVYEYLSL